MTGYENALSLLPPKLARSVEKSALKSSLWEIRLREQAPLSLTAGGENLCIDQEGRRCHPRCALICTEGDLQWVLEQATESSLYRYMPSLQRGYVTTSVGVRVGIGSRGVYGLSSSAQSVELTSLNIRIPCGKSGGGEQALRHYARHGLGSTLFFAPPGGGKTTLMRDLALRLSMGELGRLYRVAVADEREELFPPHGPKPRGLVDLLSGYPKEEAMERAVRVLNPEILICDELGRGECEAIGSLAASGVMFMATAHACSSEELMRQREVAQLIREGYFRYLARLFLSGEGLKLEWLPCGEAP